MKRYLIYYCAFLLSHSSLLFAQDGLDKNSIFSKIEELIIQGKNDSVDSYDTETIKDPYASVLKRIASNDNATYSDYHIFSAVLLNRSDIKFEDVSNFLNAHAKEPSREKDLDIDFVKMKSVQIHGLREWINIETANKEQIKLENYVKYFEKKDIDVRRAKLYVDLHQAVLLAIQRDIENGKKLCETNIKIARLVGDIEQEMAFSYYLLEFIILTGDLDQYIEVCERSLKIEQSLERKTFYHSAIMYKALDAYIYKGGSEKRVLELFNDISSKIKDHTLKAVLNIKYVNYLGDKNLSPNTINQIFNQFKVSDLKAFCKKITIYGKEHLNNNDLKRLYNTISITLEKHNYLKEAIVYKEKAVELTQKIYTQELANSLAEVKSKNAIESKNLELKYEKERSKLFLLIGSLAIIALVFMGIAFLRKRKYSKVLKAKNKRIDNALNQKKILIREIHHRVKNNYQIISSLLDMQSEAIKDNKVLEIFKEGQNRMRSMAIIHEDLSQSSEDLIDFELYIELLVQEIGVIYEKSDKSIDVCIEAKNIYFDIDTAVPLGLIINELTTNAYKYAFKNRTEGLLKIIVQEKQKGEFYLRVSDNGVGFDHKRELKQTNSIGLTLVKRLVKQLYGAVDIVNDNGTHFNIVFQDTIRRSLID